MVFEKICHRCNQIFQVDRKWNGKEFYQRKKERSFCSQKCANRRVQTKEMNEARRKKLQKHPNKFCECGVQIHYRSIYCRKCSNRRRRKEIKYEVNENGCHICTSHVYGSNGASAISIGNKHVDIYRYLWIQEKGEISEGLTLRHKCDDRRCINLDHLELGTHADNMRDMVERGRSVKGERVEGSKLKEEEVLFIKNDTTHSNKELSIMFKVRIYHIWRIKNNKSWKHI